MVNELRDTSRTVKWTDSDDCLCMEMAKLHEMYISRYLSKLVNDDAALNKNLLSMSSLSNNHEFNNSQQVAIKPQAITTELIAQVAVAVALAMKGMSND